MLDTRLCLKTEKSVTFCSTRIYWSKVFSKSLLIACIVLLIFTDCFSLQCFDAVGWAAGRASGL